MGCMEYIPSVVITDFYPPADIIPVSLSWGGEMLEIIDIGRFWEDELGKHFLVMTPGDKIFELVLNSKNFSWLLRPVSGFNAV